MSITTTKAPKFDHLPKDYTGLCQLLMPRPIHDEIEYENVLEIMNVLAVAGEEKLNQDQSDYLEILTDLVEKFDQDTLEPLPKLPPHVFIKTHLEDIGMTATEWGRRIGIDRGLASRLLRGERRLSVEHLQRTTDALNLPRGVFI